MSKVFQKMRFYSRRVKRINWIYMQSCTVKISKFQTIQKRKDVDHSCEDPILFILQYLMLTTKFVL